MQVWKIQCVLLQTVKDEDEVIRGMSEKMIVKFEKYWNDYSVTLAMGAVLDPRMKLEMLRCCYSEIDVGTADEKVAHVKSNLYMLFEKYAAATTNNNQSNSNVQTNLTSGPLPKTSRSTTSVKRCMFDELKKHNMILISQAGKSQLDVYLDEPIKELDEELDVLKWWKGKVTRFPDLSLLARDLLSIPITTVASESAFSIGAHVLNKYRSRLLPKNVQALICTRNWLHGFANNDEDDDESNDIGNGTTSRMVD
ncbi:PREDICTED: zinc finger BED domain-containing protein DAYSLEEPER-like [Lupinus angustifolius]|uniref:zinc finger BED domain-containing protein DAYSLEEPER-like n=1 Tax=Lupinus angustifolius TaxID=3871 RepID=UPI00092EBF80|nr:PREDICTED: zinc finger BED domain-containing protein DAYSLEEPER-like [Lupinus angustifolius]